MSVWTDKDGRRHAGVMVGGKRLHRKLEEGATAGDAKLVEAGLRKSIKPPGQHEPGDPLLVELMPLYIAHAKANLRAAGSAETCAKRIAPWLEGYRASHAKTVRNNIVKDLRAHYAPATINRSLAALTKALSLAFDDGLIPINYGASVKSLPTNNKRELYLSKAQVDHLASCGPQAMEAAVWIALLTGCRRGEILKLRPEDIGRDTITIHSGNTKTLRTRTIPIAPGLRKWLKHVPIAYKDFEGLKTAFQRARIKAEMPWIHFHDLRHSCASILLATGSDLYEVSKILGHSSTQTTERYAHMEVSRQRAALKRAFR